MLLLSMIAASFAAEKPQIRNPESLEGITHYGMSIQEIIKKYKKDNSDLQVIYSKNLSDDNMDNYVKRFYDELLLQIEKWMYDNKLPASNLKIVISNCKFCKVGYCKKKNVKELTLVLFINEKESKKLEFKHVDIIDKNKFADMARSSVIQFLDKR